MNKIWRIIDSPFFPISVGFMLLVVGFSIVFVEGCSQADKPQAVVGRLEPRIEKLEETVNGGGCIPSLRDTIHGQYDDIDGLRQRILVIEDILRIEPPEEDLVPPMPPFDDEPEPPIEAEVSGGRRLHPVQRIVRIRQKEKSLLIPKEGKSLQ